VILVPLLALTYWCAQSVFPTISLRWADKYPWLKELATRPQSWLLVASAVVLVVMRYLDDVMPVPHLYYRERLATAFVGRRRLSADRESVRYEQPPWSIPIQLSRLSRGPKPATLPNLVICAAANLSGDVPLGRAATGFTFEKDVCGSPLTGYVSTAFLEELAVGDTLTMPALMAISGAAVAPSMGKMTRPSLRFVMALFNLRLGVWLPNPFSIRPRMSAREARLLREVRQAQEAPSELAPATEPPKSEDDRKRQSDRYNRRKWRPGSLHVFREAFGMNSLNRRFIYTSDGGHFDNLGLVELLRRGCGLIVCLDAAGDDLHHFNTLSEAIALARAELGVEVRIDVDRLRPDEDSGYSPTDHVVGRVTYPDGTKGTLIFCKAAMPIHASQDIKAYREVEPQFPTHPTTDQFFDERAFESYRVLGALAARGAIFELSTIDSTRFDQAVKDLFS
jgi:hypothetical protein